MIPCQFPQFPGIHSIRLEEASPEDTTLEVPHCAEVDGTKNDLTCLEHDRNDVDEVIIRGEACGHQSCLINFEVLSDQFHKPPRNFL